METTLVYSRSEDGYISPERLLEDIKDASENQSECAEKYHNLLATIHNDKEKVKNAFLALVPDSFKAIIDNWPQSDIPEEIDEGGFDESLNSREKWLRATLRKTGKPEREADVLPLLNIVTLVYEARCLFGQWEDIYQYEKEILALGDKKIQKQEDNERIKNAAKILGKKGGSVKSERKTKAVKENAKNGGRPVKNTLANLIKEYEGNAVEFRDRGTNSNQPFWTFADWTEEMSAKYGNVRMKKSGGKWYSDWVDSDIRGIEYQFRF
jgi:hypothetical protein